MDVPPEVEVEWLSFLERSDLDANLFVDGYAHDLIDLHFEFKQRRQFRKLFLRSDSERPDLLLVGCQYEGQLYQRLLPFAEVLDLLSYWIKSMPAVLSITPAAGTGISLTSQQWNTFSRALSRSTVGKIIVHSVDLCNVPLDGIRQLTEQLSMLTHVEITGCNIAANQLDDRLLAQLAKGGVTTGIFECARPSDAQYFDVSDEGVIAFCFPPSTHTCRQARSFRFSHLRLSSEFSRSFIQASMITGRPLELRIVLHPVLSEQQTFQGVNYDLHETQNHKRYQIQHGGVRLRFDFDTHERRLAIRRDLGH